MIRIIKKFYRLLNSHQKKRVAVLFFMMLLGACFEVMGVSMMLPLVTAAMNPDIIEENRLCAWICHLFQIDGHAGFIIWCIIMLVSIYLIKAAYLTFEYYIQYRFVCNNRFLTQSGLLAAYLKRPYESFISAQSGEIIRIVQEDARNAFDLLTVILGFAAEAIVSAALIITVFVINPFMTLFASCAVLSVIAIVSKIFRPLLKREGIAYQRTYAQTNKWLLQSISGIKEVKVTNTEEFFLHNFMKYGKRMVNAARWNSTLQMIPRNLIELASVCSMMAVFGIMIASGYSLDALIPSLSAFVMAAVKLLPSANRMLNAVTQAAFYEPALDNMLKNLRILGEEDDAGKAGTDEISITREIRLQGISYTYPGSKKQILQHAQMTIPAGSTVGIAGASGAGKTTAVDIMLGLLSPQEGKVLADGVDISANMKGWLGCIGYIPQMIYMLDDTIRENIVFGSAKSRYTDEAVWKALEEAQLADFVRGLPDALDTVVGERGVRFSGGQRQRIGIARALFRNPAVLVFDEATSALDYETEEAVMQSVHGLHGKKTMVIIAHRLKTIEECDIVYSVRDGQLIQEK